VPNTLGVNQRGVEAEIRELLPGYMAMGEAAWPSTRSTPTSGHMQGPENTLPMMMGKGPFGNLEMGGMFTVVKVRDDLAAGDFRDPGWYPNPKGTVAHRISADPDFGSKPNRSITPR
jgi:hypothetical protein